MLKVLKKLETVYQIFEKDKRQWQEMVRGLEYRLRGLVSGEKARRMILFMLMVRQSVMREETSYTKTWKHTQPTEPTHLMTATVSSTSPASLKGIPTQLEKGVERR